MIALHAPFEPQTNE